VIRPHPRFSDAFRSIGRQMVVKNGTASSSLRGQPTASEDVYAKDYSEAKACVSGSWDDHSLALAPTLTSRFGVSQ